MKIDINALNDSIAATKKQQQNSSGTSFQDVLASVQKSTPEQELDKYLKMTPEQRMRDSILQQMGISEDQLAAMPPEQRKAIEDKIAHLIQQKMEQAAGKSSTPGASSGLTVSV
jgi:predicted flavoprotein YhiN